MKARNFLRYFLVFLGFAAFYAAYAHLFKVDMQVEYQIAAAHVPSIRNFSSGTAETIKTIAGTWGVLVGVGLGLVSFLISLVLLGILKLTRLARFALAHAFALILAYGAWLVLAVELLYYENRYSAISIGVIVFAGHPMYVASVVALILVAAFYLLPMFINLFRKNGRSAPLALLLLSGLVFLPGCDWISGIETISCMISDDPSHCYQDAAISSGDPDDCDKVVPKKEFEGLGSNPPRDKCYMMVAQNTGDLSACDKIQGGPMSYTREECILTASLENENPSGCQMLDGSAKEQCLAKLGPKITPDRVLEIDSQIETIRAALAQGADPNLEKQLRGLETMRTDMLAAMTKENMDSYEVQSDPLNKEIIGDWAVGNFDSKTKNDLINLNERLKDQGSSLTKEQYEQIRDYLKFVNDPANDIEQMSDADIVKDGFGDKVGNLVNKLKFWKTNDTAAEKLLDQQLRFYERMLERQEGITEGLTEAQQDFENTAEQIANALGDKVADDVKDKIIEEILGNAASLTTKVTTAVLGEALKEVQNAAKAAEFRGLVRAYDLGMAEEISKFGGDVDRAHAEVVKKMTADPYAYADDRSFAQYGNLIENKECDGSNPHCLNKDVFWKAMKKSYKYQNPGR